MQKVQIKGWGNSLAIRIPKNILDSLQIESNDTLTISADPKQKTILLQKEENLTPYEKLMLRGANAKKRKEIMWDRKEENKGLYQ